MAPSTKHQTPGPYRPAALHGPPSISYLRAMNSDIDLVSYEVDAERRLGRARRWLAGFESRFSRFRALSELSRLNASAGRVFVASPRLFELVGAALELARRSGGLFDPTLLRELVEAGYDRSFELLAAGRTRGSVS